MGDAFFSSATIDASDGKTYPGHYFQMRNIFLRGILSLAVDLHAAWNICLVETMKADSSEYASAERYLTFLIARDLVSGLL